jgi:hypothetical protein
VLYVLAGKLGLVQGVGTSATADLSDPALVATKD